MQKAYVRYNNHAHGPKRQVIGSPAQHVPPAWRASVVHTGLKALTGSTKGKEVQGSKIFISGLPFDVGEQEIKELFSKTIGPLREVFIVYNSQGKSKGMAVVTFQRPEDADVARTKYHGKIVDGRRPIKIEIMIDSNPSTITPTTSSPPSLLSRIGVAPNPVPASPPSPTLNGTMSSAPLSPPHPQRVKHLVVKPPVLPPRRVAYRKRGRRLRKRTTIQDLDKEIDEYRAAAPETSYS